jgi:hypothetical protein
MKALSRVLFEHDYRTVELEFRIGINGKNDVGELRWSKLRKFLGKETSRSTTVEKIVKTHDGTSSRYVLGAGEPHWNHKKRVHTEDIRSPPWYIRTAVAMEYTEPAPVAPVSWSFQRTKERYSYVVGAWTIDMTKVASVPPIDVDTDHSYEVEIELTDRMEFFGKELGEILASGHAIAKDMIAKMSAP